MKPVFLVSPLNAPTTKEFRQHLNYARQAMKHSLNLNEAPFVPHLLYPTVLADSNPPERETGMAAGVAWLSRSEALVVYADLGISPGMQDEISLAVEMKIPIEFRYMKTSKSPPKKSLPESDKTLDSGADSPHEGVTGHDGPTPGQSPITEGTE